MAGARFFRVLRYRGPACRDTCTLAWAGIGAALVPAVLLDSRAARKKDDMLGRYRQHSVTRCDNGSFADELDKDSAKFSKGCPNDGRSRLIFFGTGSSTGTPTPFCLLDEHKEAPRCRSTRLALSGEPHLCKNYRGNPSLLICYSVPSPESKDGFREIYVQIDAGKTMREAWCRWFPRRSIASGLAAVILTHDHADAILGLDDLRGLQTNESPSTLVYLDDKTHSRCKATFPYLMPKPQHMPAEQPEVERKVARLDWNIIEPFVVFKPAPTEAPRFEVTPLPVQHGADYLSLGFVFGAAGSKVAYLSDVSAIPAKTMSYLQGISSEGKLDLLVLDCLHPEERHNTHMNLPESLEVVRKLRPRRTLFVGLSDRFVHDEGNAELAKFGKEHGLNVALSYDGLTVPAHL